MSEKRRKFVNLLLRFSGGMAECWPEHKKIQTMASQLGIILRTEVGAERITRQWLDYLAIPLDDDAVKYAKPVNRILGRQNSGVCTMYHAFAYGDVDTAAGERNPLSGYINLAEILSDASFAESRETTLHYLREINKAVYACFEMEPPECPTRPEIAEEIQRHRASSETPEGKQTRVTMNGTIREVLLQLAGLSEKAGGDPETIAAIRDEANPRDWVQEWHELMQGPSEHHSTLYEACSRDAYGALSEAPPGSFFDKLRLSEVVSTGGDAEEARALVSQINVLTQVHGNMPGGMRDRIEEAAQRLAGKIMSGDASLSNIDLNEIGNEVLEGCNPEDLNSLAENIGSLLPELAGNMQILQQATGGANPLAIAEVAPPQEPVD